MVLGRKHINGMDQSHDSHHILDHPFDIFCDIIVTSYAQKYQKCIDLGDSGVLSMNKKMRNKQSSGSR